MRRGAIAALVIGFGGACSAGVEPAPPPEPLPIAHTIAARDLPPYALKSYKLAMPEHEPDDGTTGYRAGNLDTAIVVFETQDGDVFVDRGGGGHAWAKSCDAINEFTHRNGWRNGVSCVNGSLDDF